MRRDEEKASQIAEHIKNIMVNEESEPAQSDSFDHWFASNHHAPQTVSEFMDEKTLNSTLQEYKENHSKEAAERFKSAIKESRKRRRWVHVISAATVAASVAFFLVFGISKETAIENTPDIIVEKRVLATKLQVKDDNGSYVPISKEATQVTVPEGYKYSLSLHDGSVITLNSNSTVIVPHSEDGRYIELKGEALCDIAKSNTPFLVKCGEAVIRVYGTTFNVNYYNPNKLETLLLSGSLSVSGSSNSQEIMIKPMQKVTLDMCSDTYSIKSLDENCAEHSIEWTKLTPAIKKQINNL